MDLAAVAPWAALVAALLVFLWLDLHYFALGREPDLREAVIWSIGWLALSLLAALVVLAFRDADAAVLYTTVYLIERSLSLDNLFVFILLFSYFAVPSQLRARLLFFGIVGALVLRGLFILGGVAIINEFHFVAYVLGAALLLLAYRILRGMDEAVEPDRNVMIRVVRRLYPVSAEYHGRRWFLSKDGRRHTTPLFLCLTGIVFADVAFAIDSIPAAFAITRDPFLIWMGNVFALLGLRALFVLVEGLMRRFRYLDETIAVLLALVAVKLLTEDLVHIGPVVSFAVVAGAFILGIVLSLVADRLDPHAEKKRRERRERMQERTHPDLASSPERETTRQA